MELGKRQMAGTVRRQLAWLAKALAPINLFARLSRTTLAGLASASVWQIANYVIPLLTVPYLARILGVSGFGIFGIGVAVSGYAQLLTDWGFNLSATQAVARERSDLGAVNRIVWSTISAKGLLGVTSCALLIGGALLFAKNPMLRAVLMLSSLNVLASIFSLDWALRGMEQFYKFTVASVVGRLAAVPLVFVLVHDPSQVGGATFASALGGLIGTATTLTMAAKLGILKSPDTSMSATISQLKNGAHIFLSTAAINLYTNSLSVVLGAVSGAQQVGLFSGSNKVRLAAHGLLSPISMVFYPRISYLSGTDLPSAQRLGLRILFIQGGMGLLLSVAVYLTAPLAVRILLGHGYEDAIPILRVLSSLIFIVAVSNVLGLMIMLPMGMRREFTSCIVFGAAVGFGLSIPFSIYAGGYGIAIDAVLAETAVTIAMYSILAFKLEWFRPLRYLNGQ